MTRSTAGVAPPAALGWLGLVAADDDYRGAPFAVAAGVVASPSRAEPGLYGRPLPALAHLVGQHCDTVRKHLRRLTADGLLPVERKGGGRGRPTLFRLEHPTLVHETHLPEGGFQPGRAPETTLAGGGFRPETTLAGGGFQPETTLAGGGFQRPLLISARAAGAGGAGAGDPHPPNHPAVVQDVLARLPRRLQPYSGNGRAAVADKVADLLARGWPPEQLLEVAHEPLPAEIPYPWAFLEARFAGRAPRVEFLTATPTAARYVAPDTSGALSPDELAERASRLRAQLRGAS